MKDPAKSVKSIRYEIKQRVALTDTELKELRDACETLREKAIVEFLYSTGCRVSELCKVKLNDIDWNDGTVRLHVKGNKWVTSFINKKCEKTLKGYIDSRKDSNIHVFVTDRSPHEEMSRRSIEVILEKIVSRTGIEAIKHVTPHVIRHTTATHAMSKGMPIEYISKILGHSNVNTTMIYAKSDIQKIKDFHKKCVK